MGRTRPPTQEKSGAFFLATLLLWFVSVWFEILFNRRTELGYIIAGCGFYQLANWVCRRFVSRDPLFVNTSVSLLHSSITSASVVFILVNHWLQNGSGGMFEHSQLVGGTWAWAHQALCFSCGYFAYDQWDMLHYGLYSGFIPSILAHHLLLLMCFTLALYRNVTINYLILTLICEVCFIHSLMLLFPFVNCFHVSLIGLVYRNTSFGQISHNCNWSCLFTLSNQFKLMCIVVI
ncbi:uncharacterized protein LOC112172037 isoform X2 [Rosa chinensis]|uniref:uncharacterized protein LOC112172037 isoform X2 n=1 Tax=Rosa chinensis TaxID=74649 RepID=UPI000D08C2E3|nr:uncharacterized protein LOC112172037 isoform X2 [Rosa chinensis]